MNSEFNNTHTVENNTHDSSVVPDYESDVVKPNQGHFDIEFSVNKTSGTGNAQIKVILKAKHTEVNDDRVHISRFPSKSEVLANNIKTRKRLVVRVGGKVVKTIPVEYIPSNR